MSLLQPFSTDCGFANDHAPLSRMPAPPIHRAETGVSFTGPVLTVGQDGEIYGEGDEARRYYKVMRGVVRTSRFLSDGRRQIEAFYRAGDLFGFENAVQYRLSSEAVLDCALPTVRRVLILNRLALSVCDA